MIYGAINEKSHNMSKDLEMLFEAIDNKQKEYNWLITECNCYPNNSEIAELLDSEYCWLTGEQLTELVRKENFQWIWAVISGFDKCVELEEVLKYELPFADGYEGFWEKPLTIQHPLARVEIVPWDGYLTLFFSDDKLMIDEYIKRTDGAIGLKEYIDRD